MILEKDYPGIDTRPYIDRTRYLFEALGVALAKEVQLEDVWTKFWHVTRIIEWPWALGWFTEGAKVFDVGSDALFSILLLKEGATDVTMHHASVDVPRLGKAPVHNVGWLSLEHVWKKHEDKLKMVLGFPHQLDLASEIYDIVFNISVMEHVEPENWLKWMEATWRLLKPGGLYVMTCDYLLNIPEDGPVIDITNHPFDEFFTEVQLGNGEIITPTTHIPWHEDFDPEIFGRAQAFSHPANPEGNYTVYGFVVRKGS